MFARTFNTDAPEGERQDLLCDCLAKGPPFGTEISRPLFRVGLVWIGSRVLVMFGFAYQINAYSRGQFGICTSAHLGLLWYFLRYV